MVRSDSGLRHNTKTPMSLRSFAARCDPEFKRAIEAVCFGHLDRPVQRAVDDMRLAAQEYGPPAPAVKFLRTMGFGYEEFLRKLEAASRA